MTLVDLSSDEEAGAGAIVAERMEIHSAGGGAVGGMVATNPHRLDKRLPTPLVPRDSDHHEADVNTLQATATNALVSVAGDKRTSTTNVYLLILLLLLLLLFLLLP